MHPSECRRRDPAMAAPTRAPVPTQGLQGFEDCRVRGPLWDHRHTAGPERERAGNRPLCYAPYATLLRMSPHRLGLVTTHRDLEAERMAVA